jgi:porin
MAACLHGGIKTGFTWLGLIDLSAYLSTSSLGLWKGGSFFADLQNTHNGMPSANLVGDVQAFDNIENGNHTYLFQLFYRQQIGNLWILTGLHDLNSEFLSGDYSSDFINSSLGIMPVVSMNSPVSIFPRTTLALAAGYQLSHFSLKAGVYNGDAGSFEEDPYNLKFSLARGGRLTIFEAQAEHHLINGLNGKLRAGLTFLSRHSAIANENGNSSNGKYTFYIMADQEILKEKDNNQGLGFMVQMGMTSAVANDYDLFYSFGLNYRGPFINRDRDIFGLAFARVSAGKSPSYADSNGSAGESVIELFYKTHISDHFCIQPCFQQIFNPGVNAGLSNASAIILRIEISN